MSDALFNHPEARRLAEDVEIARLRDQTITQAFVAGQMDAQYTASVRRLEAERLFDGDSWSNPSGESTRQSLKLLKAKAYALAQDSIDALIAVIRAEYKGNEGMLFRQLSAAFTGGNASTWEEVIHAAEQREAARRTWQPIETAPRDVTGKNVLVAMITDGKVRRVSEASFNGVGWYDRGGNGCHWRTHWMPMPMPEVEP